MGLITFEIHKKGRRTTKNLSRELMWYEWAKRGADGNIIEKGKMHKMQGGRLDFKYDFDEKKLHVSTAPVQITSYETYSNEKEIDGWIEAHEVELKLTRVSGERTILTFPDKNKEAVKDALDDTSFSFEIV